MILFGRRIERQPTNESGPDRVLVTLDRAWRNPQVALEIPMAEILESILADVKPTPADRAAERARLEAEYADYDR